MVLAAGGVSPLVPLSIDLCTFARWVMRSLLIAQRALCYPVRTVTGRKATVACHAHPCDCTPRYLADNLTPPDELPPAEEDETSAFVAEVNARLSIGKLPQVVRSSPTRAPSSEEETPVDGPGAVENWLGLVDHAQALQAQALAATPLHPVLERHGASGVAVSAAV